MIKVKIGDIFESKMNVLVNTVNCVGVMGKGVAKIFKEKYPRMFDEYKMMCDEKNVKTGKLFPYFENEVVKLINFPTKQHWKSPSKLEYITSGLEWFRDNYKDLGILSIAFPPLGCGNGGLSWDVVGPIMYQILRELPINIEIYAPFGTEKEKISDEYLSISNTNQITKGITYKEINSKWLLALRVVECLEGSKYSIKVGRTIFQKICYVLARNGINMGLNFTEGTYGPYSRDIKEMITALSNNNLIYEKAVGKMILIYVSENFKINPLLYTNEEKESANKTFDLFKRIKDTEQAEMITTILFSHDQLKDKGALVTENMLYNYIIGWKKRYDSGTYELKIRELSKSLASLGLIEVDYSQDYKINEVY